MIERLGGEVKRELSRFGGAASMTELVGAWPAAVGETVAANAWPARLARDGTLHVNAASSTWAFELQQLESEIAGRLREAVPEAAPARLRFAPGPLPELPAAPPEDAKRPSAGAHARAGAGGARVGRRDRVRRSPQIGRKSCADEPRKRR